MTEYRSRSAKVNTKNAEGATEVSASTGPTNVFPPGNPDLVGWHDENVFPVRQRPQDSIKTGTLRPRNDAHRST